jgi:hypothetical protein
MLEFAVFLVLFFIVLAVAFVLNWKLVACEPSSRPFRWGYFFAIYDCRIISAALVANRVIEHGPTNRAIEIGVAAWLLIVALTCYPTLKRYRWGWVLGTVLSLNVVIWIVNYFYGKRRWSELKGGPIWAAFRRTNECSGC